MPGAGCSDVLLRGSCPYMPEVMHALKPCTLQDTMLCHMVTGHYFFSEHKQVSESTWLYRCDLMIHSANAHTAKHHRLLLVGMDVGLTALPLPGEGGRTEEGTSRRLRRHAQPQPQQQLPPATTATSHATGGISRLSCATTLSAVAFGRHPLLTTISFSW